MKFANAAAYFVISVAPFAALADTTLTILHFNDAESHLTATEMDGDVSLTGTDQRYAGGAAAFVSLVHKLRAEAATDGVITISAGDNFLCGMAHDADDPRLNPANSKGVNYDAAFFAATKVDVAIPGNHDFDFGPIHLIKFINAVHAGEKDAIEGFDTRFVCCNLDASACPGLESRIAPATVVCAGKLKIGVVGDVTGDLESLSNPQPVKTIDADGDGDSDLDDIAILVQRQIDRLTTDGIDKIVLVSHLQSVRNDQALVRKLRGVDVAVSGGGHEALSNSKIFIKNLPAPYGPYPLLDDENCRPVVDLDGVNVPIVVAESGLEFIGKLVVKFDDKGRVISASGDTIPTITCGEARKQQWIYQYVEKPVADYVECSRNAILAASSVNLECRREFVRSRETNFGDLVADAVFDCAANYAKDQGLKKPDVAVVNGGGIRCDLIVNKGDVSLFTLRSVLPFHNSVAIVENVPPADFKAIAENMVGSVEKLGGCFGQISGFFIVYDPTMSRGSRVIDIVLSDGRAIVRGGKIEADAPEVTFATLDYLARGGDGYSFGTNKAIDVGVVEWEAVRGYISQFLGGKITAKNYPENGLNRISCAILERNR